MNKGYSRLIKEEPLQEEATQVSNVDAGVVSVFGSDAGNKFSEENWYKQLFELNDIDEAEKEVTIDDQYKIESSILEDTGGHTMVQFGKLANGLYFGLNEDHLVLYDADYHEAWENNSDDLYEWEEAHRVNYFDQYDTEYSIVANQTEYFKEEILEEEKESSKFLITHIKLNKYVANDNPDDLEWKYTEDIKDAKSFDTYEDAFDFIHRHSIIGEADAEFWDPVEILG